MCAGRNCPAVILLAFLIFDGYLTMKLSDIYCILCVECVFRKSFQLVAQNYGFQKERNLEMVIRRGRTVAICLNVTVCTKVKIECC